jgi:hypothetical protein
LGEGADDPCSFGSKEIISANSIGPLAFWERELMAPALLEVKR